MLPGIFSGQGHASNAKYFDIRLQDDYVVFRGNEQEASSAHLKGSVVLCLSEPMTMKHLRLTLTGISRVSWTLPTSASSRRAWRERNFFEKTWMFRDPGRGRTEILKADNYEFPFDVVLEGSLPESVEGLGETFVIYRFRAEIGRKYSKDIVARKPLRIIRTLDPSNLELSHAMSVENIWPNKIQYSISTPTKAVVFGTSVRIDFRLVSLLKGLRIGQITTQVLESHELTLDPDAASTYYNTHKAQKIIAEDEHVVDDGSEPQVLNEEAEGYEFARHIELPKTLRRCLQDTETRGIKVRHKLKFNVQLHNPDGHVSELRASLPVALFISPTMPINENNDLVDQTPVAGRIAAEDQLNASAPPLYGEHHFDQLYSDVDNTGYWTPGAALSTSSTPLGPHSRSVSNENLVNLGGVANGNVSATALQHRLNNLPISSPRHSPNAQDSDYFPHHRNHDASSNHSASDPTSAEMSRRSSADAQVSSGAHTGANTPVPYFNEYEDISRIPSYSTAVKTPFRSPQPTNLPSYDDATSRDHVSDSPILGIPQAPSQAHIRSQGVGSRSGPNLVSLIHEDPPDIRRSYSVGNVTGVASRERPVISDHGSSTRTMQDEDSRLRLLRARAGQQ